MFRRVLVPVRGDGYGEKLLSLGAAVVRPHGGHLMVMHVHARPQDLLPYGVPIPSSLKATIFESAQRMAKDEEGRLHELFKAFCKTHDITEIDTLPTESAPGKVTATWQEVEGKQADLVGVYGRLADLIVVPRPDKSANFGINTFRSALFGVGALTAVAANREVSSVLGHIAIGWNGSVEAARAVKRSMRLLDNAEKITIVSGEGETLPVLGPDALVDYLGSHGIAAEVHRFNATKHDVGPKLVETLGTIGAEAFLMGSYGESSGSDYILGGASDYVLQHADVPLLMAH